MTVKWFVLDRRRRLWHAAHRHESIYERCRSDICRGDQPVPDKFVHELRGVLVEHPALVPWTDPEAVADSVAYVDEVFDE